MGKKNSALLKKKVDASWTVNSSPTARNLSKNQLGGVIFGCKYHTFSECLNKNIFGLPAAHYSYVKNITPGLALFLFNYSDRKLHGVFEAVSCGQMNMDQYAWATCEGVEYTPYAAQVRMKYRTKCRALFEDEYKPAIEKNYYTEKLFWFELDKAQTHRLVKLFLLSPLPENMPRPLKAPKQVNTFEVLSSSDVNVAADEEFENLESLSENSYAAVLVTTHASDPTDKKWTDLFKKSSSKTVMSKPTEAWPKAADTESNSPVVDCWEVHDPQVLNGWEDHALVNRHDSQEICENVDPLYSERLEEWGVPSSDNVISSQNVMSKPPPEAWPTAAHIESDSPVVDCWEVHDSQVLNGWEDHALVNRHDSQEKCENVDPLDSERPEEWGVPSSDNVISSDREGSELETSDSQSQSDLADRDVPKNYNALSGEGVLTVTYPQSFDFETVINKMKQEIEGFKFSQLKQRLKMDSLEQELVHSKLEIDHLKKRCHKLESIRSIVSDQCNLEDCNKSEEYVLIVRGSDGNSRLSDLCMYSPLQDNVVSLCPMTFPRSSASVAKLNGELYVFGGIHDGVWYDTVESYNPIINNWIQRPSLSKKKGGIAGASMYETIFAMGGGNEVECLSEVELLDLNIGSWMSTQSMLEKRVGAAAAYMNGALYVAGGFDGKEYLRSVERFDPRQHGWTRVASMNSRRGSHSLVALKDELYALGGYDGKAVVSTVEVFDPRIGSWMMEEPMTVPRVNFGSFVFRGKIYVIGGDVTEGLDVQMECYEPGCGWQVTGSPKLGKGSSVSALVI